MSIPVIQSGTSMLSVRVDSLNPAISRVNTLVDDLSGLSVKVEDDRVSCDAKEILVNARVDRLVTDVSSNTRSIQLLSDEIVVLHASDELLRASDTIIETKLNSVETKLNTFTPTVTTTGTKYAVEHRGFNFTSSSNTYKMVIPLTATEFIVRATVRTFDSGKKLGTMKSSATLTFDRNTNTLSVDVGTARTGMLFIELWRAV